MKGATLFSGIGAPEVAAPWMDWLWSADIDAFANAVRTHHWPEIPNFGDVSALNGEDLERPDVIVFGGPCQDFSTGAPVNTGGRRLGSHGDRGRLAVSGINLSGQIVQRAVVFENVPGILTANRGHDFLHLLAAVESSGLGWAYRVICPAAFGGDQPRPRLFLVGHRDGAHAAREILSLGKGADWHRKAITETAPVLTARGAMAYDDRTPCILEPRGARIATPEEWEAAMGFPSGHTAIEFKGKPAKDAPRYRAIGNSQDVSIVGMILDRIRLHEEAA